MLGWSAPTKKKIVSRPAHGDSLLEHQRQLHSTNPLERLNKEIKRRANVVGILPDAGIDEAADRAGSACDRAGEIFAAIA